MLSDAEKRARYDRYGHAGLEGGRRRAALPRRRRHLRGLRRHLRRRLFGDLFGGGRGGAPRPPRGRHPLRGDARPARGGPRRDQRRSSSTATSRATTCGGSGAKPGTQPEPCRYCGGQGQVVQSTGIFSRADHLPLLPGSGLDHPRSLLRLPRRRVTCQAGHARSRRSRPASTTDTRLRLPGRRRAEPRRRPAGRLLLLHPRHASTRCSSATDST